MLEPGTRVRSKSQDSFDGYEGVIVKAHINPAGEPVFYEIKVDKLSAASVQDGFSYRLGNEATFRVEELEEIPSYGFEVI
jgi:FAD synthase